MRSVTTAANGFVARVVFGAALLLAPAAAGCGAGSGSPSVANLATTTSGVRTSSPGPQTPVAPVLSPQTETAIDEAYAACMTAHGVAARVMPGGAGVGFFVHPGSAGPGSPQFNGAQRACKRLLPKSGLPAPASAQHSGVIAQLLKFAVCMRAHGVPNFPDPGLTGLHIGPNIDPRSPQFQAAQKACARDFPGGSPPQPAP
jgi:hypothetical protein